MNKGLKLIDWSGYREAIVEYVQKQEGLIDFKSIHDHIVRLATEKGDKDFLALVDFGKTRRQVRSLKDDGKLDLDIASSKIAKKNLRWEKYDDTVIEMVLSGRYDVSSNSDLHEFYFALRGRADAAGDLAFVRQLNAKKLKDRVQHLTDEGRIISAPQVISYQDTPTELDNFEDEIENGESDTKSKKKKKPSAVRVKEDRDPDDLAITDDKGFADMMVDTNTETWREHNKKVFLRRNFRNEAYITNLREYVVRTVESKAKGENVIPTTDAKRFIKKPETGLTLEYVLTDLHINETSDIPGKEWTAKRAMEDLGRTVTKLKELNKTGRYDELVLYFPGDNVGTKIHEEINLDLAPLKAAKALANAAFRMVIALRPFYKKIRIGGVGGNHAETRVRGEKPNSFGENYDYAFLEELRSLLSIIGMESSITYHGEHSDTTAIEVAGRNVAITHGDRSTSMINLYPKLRDDYKVSRIDRLYVGHFHLENYFYDEGVLKMFHPCFTNPGLYARNGFGGIVSRDRQNAHEIGKDGSIKKTFRISLDDGNIPVTDLGIDVYGSSSDIFAQSVKLALAA